MRFRFTWRRESDSAAVSAHETGALTSRSESTRALVLALEAFEREPTNADALREAVEQCNRLRDFGRAHDLLSTAREIQPWLVATLIADTHLAARDFEHELAARREASEAKPDRGDLKFKLIRASIRAGQLDEARQEITRLELNHPAAATWMLRIDLLNAEQRRGDALFAAIDAFEEAPDEVRRYRLLLRQTLTCLRKDGDPMAARKAHEILDGLGEDRLGDLLSIIHAIGLAVAVGREETVRSLIDLVPSDNEQKEVLRTRAWLAHRDGDLGEARKIWRHLRNHSPMPSQRVCRAGELERRDGNLLPPAGDEIRLYTVVRNELWRLQWFVSYYRKLGVDRFFFVDNDSSDGSLAWLLEQPDVHVFHAGGSYAEAASGTVWLNQLVREHSPSGWQLYVDVDEALVFADVENHGLRGLTEYMERKGHDLAAGQMVDMFSMEAHQPSDDRFEDDFVSRYPFFSHEFERTQSVVCPYFFTVGGIRQLAGFGENNTKTPLARGGREIQYLSSSHMVTPGVVSDVGVALLHYKLVGDFLADFRRDVAENHRVFHCTRRYEAYTEFFETWGGDLTQIDPASVGRYSSSRSLLDHGLVTPLPEDFGADAG